ncbi:MAG: ferredoxin [Candidatus Woesearchaeota archaeon]|jgi:ferredoxin
MTEEKTYKLEQNRPECIGCGACVAVAPDFWEMVDDGKSSIIKSKTRDDGWEEKEISEKEFQHNKEAAESCPVTVIHLTNINTNEKII